MNQLSPPPLRTNINSEENASRPWQSWFSDVFNKISYLWNNPYVLPQASAKTLGGVKAGANISIDKNGVISATSTPYTLPVASDSVLGGVKIGANINEDKDGTISVTIPESLPWDKITDTPTTLSGYGITDVTGSATPGAHHLTHEPGGGDEVGVFALRPLSTDPSPETGKTILYVLSSDPNNIRSMTPDGLIRMLVLSDPINEES